MCEGVGQVRSEEDGRSVAGVEEVAVESPLPEAFAASVVGVVRA